MFDITYTAFRYGFELDVIDFQVIFYDDVDGFSLTLWDNGRLSIVESYKKVKDRS